MVDEILNEGLEQEAISLTLNSLLTNPTGKYTSFMSSRARIIEDLEMRYAKLMNKHKKLSFKVYKEKKNYIFIFKVPSETHDEFFYDVGIQFIPEKKDYEKDRTLNRYILKLFSNSPNFTFTYTYTLNKSGIIVPFLKSKCNDKALKEPPKIRNPVEAYGFEKSCYYACMYIKDIGLTNKFEIDANLYFFNRLKILKDISSQEDKLKEYNLFKANKKKNSTATKRKSNNKKSPTKKKKTK